MKNYFLYTTLLCLGAFIIFASLKNEPSAVEKQNEEIQIAVEENLAIFSEEKEDECQAKALKAAIIRVENMGKEKEAAVPDSNPELPPTSKPKPVTPSNTTTTTPPPVPPPTTDAEPVPTKPEDPTVEPSTADPATGTNVGKKEDPKTEDPVEKAKTGVNKGKKGKKSGN